MVDIHLVSWNRPNITKLVIGTIHRNSWTDTYRLHVLDNGSNKETTTMLQEMFDKNLLHSYINLMENKGLEFAREYMLERNTFNDYFIDADNDCLPCQMTVDGDWISRLVDLMDKYEDYAAIACRTQVMIGTGNIFEDDSKDITDFAHPGGSLRIMRTEAVKRVGGWDREMSGRGQEERYICGKLRDAGYKTGFATHIPTLHLFGIKDDTDRWGYPKEWKPEQSGHSDIWHPALDQGDTFVDIEPFAGEELTRMYFNVDSYSQKN
jgi:glycosyltransferase involved in cell wall biosynthesis